MNIAAGPDLLIVHASWGGALGLALLGLGWKLGLQPYLRKDVVGIALVLVVAGYTLIGLFLLAEETFASLPWIGSIALVGGELLVFVQFWRAWEAFKKASRARPSPMPLAGPAFPVRRVAVGASCLVFGVVLVSFAGFGGFDRPDVAWAAIVGGSAVAVFGGHSAWRPVVRRIVQVLQQNRE